MANGDRADGKSTASTKQAKRNSHEERRSYPRVEFTENALLATSGEDMQVSICSLSADGIQLRCTPDAANILLAHDTQIAPGQGPVVTVRFDLEVGGEENTVVAEARLTYRTAISEDEIAFGAQFVHISLEDKLVLSNYLVEAMRP